jgi:hypothetical protein
MKRRQIDESVLKQTEEERAGRSGGRKGVKGRGREGGREGGRGTYQHNTLV